MSFYTMVWILLCALSIASAVIRKKAGTLHVEFWLCFFALTAMLALRYGQGADYFSYRRIYLSMSDTAITFPNYAWSKELGFALLCNIFRVLHVPYEGFVAVVSVTEMGLLAAFLKRYHVEEPLALLLTFPTLYLTWFFSGIRQGLVIAIFLEVLFPLLEKRRYLWYAAGVLLCTQIHNGAVIYLALLVAEAIRSISRLQILTILAWLMGLVLSTQEGINLISSLGISRLNGYIGQTNTPNLFACGERLLFLLLVTWLYTKLYEMGKCGGTFECAYRCYLIGMALYGAFCWNDLVASRSCAFLRFVEIYLLVYAVQQMTKASRYLFVIALAVMQSVMVVKNLNAMVDPTIQSEHLNALTYPYIMIFDENEIYRYRSSLNSSFNFSLIIEAEE